MANAPIEPAPVAGIARVAIPPAKVAVPSVKGTKTGALGAIASRALDSATIFTVPVGVKPGAPATVTFMLKAVPVTIGVGINSVAVMVPAAVAGRVGSTWYVNEFPAGVTVKTPLYPLLVPVAPEMVKMLLVKVVPAGKVAVAVPPTWVRVETAKAWVDDAVAGAVNVVVLAPGTIV